MHIINPIYLGQNYAHFFFRAPVVPIFMVGFCPNLLPPPGVPSALALLNAVINPTHLGQTPNHAISCTPNCPPSVVPGASYSPSGTPYSRGNYGLFLNFAFRVKFEKDHNFPQNWMATEFELESGSIHHPLITCNTVITCNWEINRYNSKDIHGGVSLASYVPDSQSCNFLHSELPAQCRSRGIV